MCLELGNLSQINVGRIWPVPTVTLLSPSFTMVSSIWPVPIWPVSYPCSPPLVSNKAGSDPRCAQKKCTPGRVTSFGRPISIYEILRAKLKAVAWIGNGQMTLKVKVSYPHFQYQPVILHNQHHKRVQRCMFGANLMIPVPIRDELSRGQNEFPSILSQNGQNNLKGQSQWPPISIADESIPCCMFGANLEITPQICGEYIVRTR